MTRDEVLERLDRMEAETNRQMVLMEGSGQWAIAASHRVDAEVFSAAAELIRRGGWRPIAECGDAYLKHVGKWSGDTWKEDWNVWPEWAKANGYTHFFTEPEPPAREVENG